MNIIDGIKEVAQVVRKADNIELYRQILDLQQEAMELVEANYRLRNELRELSDIKEIQSELVFKDNVYQLNSDGEIGFYCTTCWDVNNKLVRLHENSYEMVYCPICIKK